MVKGREGNAQRTLRGRHLQARDVVFHSGPHRQVHRGYGQRLVRVSAHVRDGIEPESHKKPRYHNGCACAVRTGLLCSSQPGERSDFLIHIRICGCSRGICWADLFAAAIIWIGMVGFRSELSFILDCLLSCLRPRSHRSHR